MPRERKMPTAPDEVPPEVSGYSLSNFREILFPCLEAASPGSVLEIGAYRGDFTKELLEWAAASGARVIAIEPEPPSQLLRLCERHPELELVREPSHDALRTMPPVDAVIVDGDHNYYTVSEELRLIEERAGDAGLPLVLFHDVCWPHARRDTYYEPERIPAEHRQPLARDAAVAPGFSGTVWAGMRYPWIAAEEGGPRNGVLTAIEDFVEEREGIRFAIVPAFFGLGVMWRRDATWAEAVAEIMDPWDRNPILERLEGDRVDHLIDRALWDEQQALLHSFLHSRAFAWAEWMSRVRQRGEPIFSRKQVKRVLGAD